MRRRAVAARQRALSDGAQRGAATERARSVTSGGAASDAASLSVVGKAAEPAAPAAPAAPVVPARAASAVEGVTSHERVILEGKALLAQRLRQLGLQSVAVGDDGNCLFRAVSQQAYGDQAYHGAVRQAVCEHMRAERAFFGAMFEADELDRYIERMSWARTWGDELTIRAAADRLGCTIHVVTSTESNWYLKCAAAALVGPFALARPR